jgi:hypothetical protein
MSLFIIIFAISLIPLGLIYYRIQEDIGEQHIQEWKEYKISHPEFFKKPEPVSKEVNSKMSEVQKKSISKICG